MNKSSRKDVCYGPYNNDCTNQLCKDKSCTRTNFCNLKLKTYNCNPNDKNLWYKHQLPHGLDPVLSNIYNGCWLCNYEPHQTINNNLCARQFEDKNITPPYMKLHVNDRNFVYKNKVEESRSLF